MKIRSNDPQLGFHAEIPASFSSLEEARNCLDYHWNGCVRFFDERERQTGLTGLQDDRRKYQTIFSDWLAALDAFLANNALDSRSLRGVWALQMSHTFAIINLHARQESEIFKETTWDAYVQSYEHMLTLAQAIYTSAKSDENLNGRQRTPFFSLDMNLVAPLYAVAHKCRDPTIRRAAVALLKSTPRQEGIWDSVLAGRVAEKLVNIEEDGLAEVKSCHDVPESARISAVSVHFDMEGRLGTIRYARTGSGLEHAKENPRATDRMFVETVEW